MSLKDLIFMMLLKIPTWSHKNSYHCALFRKTVFTYLTAHFSAVTKRNVHWVPLKHRFNTWTLAHFHYVDVGTYCCVFIKLFQVRIAAVQNLNIRRLSLKGNSLSCPTPNPTLNLPSSVSKSKTYVKTYLLHQPCYLDFLVCRFELFCRSVVTRDSIWSSSLVASQVCLRTPWVTGQTYRLWKPIDMKLDMCDANVQKHQFSNLPAY